MKNKEIERVFLIKYLPKDIEKYDPIFIKVGDFYKPTRIDALMIRQKGNQYELIKKEGTSLLNRTEHTISINKHEFHVLWQVVQRSHEKKRIFYPIGNLIGELDIYQGKLLNYVRIEVEFKDENEASNFVVPDWFGEEITLFNHEIHKDLGIISFDDLKRRFKEKNIDLKII